MRKVTELRGWPEVGKTYLVTCIWVGRGWYPVHPNSHSDDEGPVPHWHVDPRFISEEMERQLALSWPAFLDALPEGQREPFMESAHPDGLKVALCMGLFNPAGGYRTRLLPLVCRHAAVQWDMPARDEYWQKAKYLPQARRDGSLKAIRSADGRPLCPHQKFDLTCVWDGQSSHVRCPLHGLLVDVR